MYQERTLQTNEWMKPILLGTIHPSVHPSSPTFHWGSDDFSRPTLLKKVTSEKQAEQFHRPWIVETSNLHWFCDNQTCFQFFSSSKWGVQRLVEAKGVDMATGESLSHVFFPWWTFLFQTRRQAELIFWGFKLSTSIMTSGIAFSIGDGLYPRWTLGSWLWCRTQHFLELVFPYGIFKGWSALAGLCHWISVACILTDSFDN